MYVYEILCLVDKTELAEQCLQHYATNFSNTAIQQLYLSKGIYSFIFIDY